jgi:hypothetical protein
VDLRGKRKKDKSKDAYRICWVSVDQRERIGIPGPGDRVRSTMSTIPKAVLRQVEGNHRRKELPSEFTMGIP